MVFVKIIFNLPNIMQYFPSIIIAMIIQRKFLTVLVPLLIWICSVIIEAYTLHRLLPVPCTKAVPRMLCINVVQMIIQLFLVQNLVVFFVTHSFKIFPILQNSLFAGVLISLVYAILIFFIRVSIAYRLYHWFDPSVSAIKLKQTVLIANLLSVVFLIIFCLVFSSFHSLD